MDCTVTLQRISVFFVLPPADAGDSMAAELLAHRGDAEVLLLNEVQVGNSEHAATALLRLLESSENPADRKRAQHIRRYGLTPPTP